MSPDGPSTPSAASRGSGPLTPSTLADAPSASSGAAQDGPRTPSTPDAGPSASAKGRADRAREAADESRPGDQVPLLPRSETLPWQPDDYRGVTTSLVSREKVCIERQRARDAWNVEELRLAGMLDRADLQISDGLTEVELEELLADFQGEAPSGAELDWALRLACRGRGGVCTSLGALHHAVRAQQGQHRLPPPALRAFAAADCWHGGTLDEGRVGALLVALNGGLPVAAAEMHAVIREAALAGGGRADRAALLRAVGAWYLCVEREGTGLRPLLLGAVGGLRALGRRLGAPAFAVRPSAPPRALAVAALLAFAAMAFVGAEHGDDRCPRDIDGLMAWFGVLGLALFAVTCADGSLEQPSGISLALMAVLLFLPWLGVVWTFKLHRRDRARCGVFLYEASIYIWTILVIVELLGVCCFCWAAITLVKHELSLRRILQTRVPEEP